MLCVPYNRNICRNVYGIQATTNMRRETLEMITVDKQSNTDIQMRAEAKYLDSLEMNKIAIDTRDHY